MGQTLSLQEFEAQRAGLRCRRCGAIGLDLHAEPNNGGVRPHCLHCGAKTPIAGVQWLRQHPAKRPARGPVDVDDVWRANGDHCAFCGKSRALCEHLGLGLTAQHVKPFYLGGDDGPLIPFCTRCQRDSASALEETRRIAQRLGVCDTPNKE